MLAWRWTPFMGEPGWQVGGALGVPGGPCGTVVGHSRHRRARQPDVPSFVLAKAELRVGLLTRLDPLTSLPPPLPLPQESVSPSNKACSWPVKPGQGYSTSAEYLQLTTCCRSQPIPAPAGSRHGRAWPLFTAGELGVKSSPQDSQLSVCRKLASGVSFSVISSNHVLIQTHSSLLGLMPQNPSWVEWVLPFQIPGTSHFNLSFPGP